MDGPLSGIRVVDLTQIYNGPYATFLMAMAGAEIIKVEPPGGEHTRRRQRDGGGAHIPHAMLNSGKVFVELDLKTEAGKAELTALIETSDVLVENFRPGVLTRLGFSRERLAELNPKLVYAASSGFGTTGPYRDYPAMDLAVQALSGVMSITGFPDNPPVKAGPAICDFNAGVHLYGAIVTALLERERTGRARAVEVSMFEAIYPALASNLGLMSGTNKDRPPRTGNQHGGLSISPYNVYACRDGWCAILANNEHQWRALARFFGQDWAIDEPRYASMYDRVARIDEVDALVAGWAAGFTKDELFRGLVAVGVPAAPVRELSEVMTDPHLHARGALVDIDHPIYGPVTLPTSPMVYEGMDRTIRWPSRKLGEDQAVLDQVRAAAAEAE
ncbi:CoA transferase [Silicimonas algicola]|uniref:Crotonobetainyl-CoA:carnitine CoA-transferase CaiB-like acyl-CoA transferase n=1 Tax=Silicimonas algicola TaxID=1826607 RepID=A0A316G0Y3_9RHOB|nr:CoA transferase [Silicimonas algicola]AZQ68282.1 CoA transferase [Silicimonas algicola]PWK54581.1 crotonobetainyl-CoA:carnitine CoA-transferase CaiB-like acyl-CoA transferase [Silicimonas algicola]